MQKIRKIGRWIIIFLTAKPRAISWGINILRKVLVEVLLGGASSSSTQQTWTPPPAGGTEQTLNQLARQNEYLTDSVRRLHKHQRLLLVLFLLTLLVALAGIYQQYDHRRSHRVAADSSGNEQQARIKGPDLPASQPDGREDSL